MTTGQLFSVEHGNNPFVDLGATPESPSSGSNSAFPDETSVSQQRGTNATNQNSSDSPFGVSAFTQFRDSERTIRLGGVAALLSAGGEYTAYRRLRGDEGE